MKHTCVLFLLILSFQGTAAMQVDAHVAENYARACVHVPAAEFTVENLLATALRWKAQLNRDIVQIRFGQERCLEGKQIDHMGPRGMTVLAKEVKWRDENKGWGEAFFIRDSWILRYSLPSGKIGEQITGASNPLRLEGAPDLTMTWLEFWWHGTNLKPGQSEPADVFVVGSVPSLERALQLAKTLKGLIGTPEIRIVFKPVPDFLIDQNYPLYMPFSVPPSAARSQQEAGLECTERGRPLTCDIYRGF